VVAKVNPHLLSVRQWYGLQQWRRKAALQVRMQRWCEECRRQGIATLAQCADHVVPVSKTTTFDAFMTSPLRSLCISCNSRRQGRGRRLQRIGRDGMPLIAPDADDEQDDDASQLPRRRRGARSSGTSGRLDEPIRPVGHPPGRGWKDAN
jgi:hypothetical protein